jgi:ABC-type transporter Mla MlaB component
MNGHFRLIANTNSKDFQICLIGDFDEDAARQLLATLERGMESARRVTVSTNCVSGIHPSGPAALARGLGKMDCMAPKVHFVGENADRIAPKGSVLFMV